MTERKQKKFLRQSQFNALEMRLLYDWVEYRRAMGNAATRRDLRYQVACCCDFRY